VGAMIRLIIVESYWLAGGILRGRWNDGCAEVAATVRDSAGDACYAIMSPSESSVAAAPWVASMREEGIAWLGGYQRRKDGEDEDVVLHIEGREVKYSGFELFLS
jgi:hypothetical protein